MFLLMVNLDVGKFQPPGVPNEIQKRNMRDSTSANSGDAGASGNDACLRGAGWPSVMIDWAREALRQMGASCRPACQPATSFNM